MRALLIVLLLAAEPALGQLPPPRPDLPILAPPALPQLPPSAHAFYARWTGYNIGRAIAFGPNGVSGGSWGARNTEEAKQRALANCAQRAQGAACALYAVDLAIVVPGAAWSPPEAPPASLGIGGFGWEVVPDARYLWHGPERARGAIVFGHGRGAADADYRGQQPQTWVRQFNNAGFDVFRFDRHPNTDDATRAASWLREGLRALRARGYRAIVMSGQSRGGWNTLQMLATPGLIDAGIAVSAAAHGQGSSMNLSGQVDQFRRLAREAASTQARVAFVQFALDPFIADHDGRVQVMREVIGPRVGAVLVIDRPEGFSGHHAGNQWQFADTYGPCLVAFVTEATPRAAC
ncbi:hypothetical protein [Elioraea rosea]|uniref:hypothetical protein n=1 Tax=Elioraea rosea TaxID=2492390 RepID=UPI001184ABCF|nr:hypothetical protein [Elioraea rosea]